MTNSMIDFLVVGHVVQDVVPNGYVVGGTATYSSITARNLGRKPGIVTRLSPDFVLPDVLHDIDIHRTPSPQTTTFHNLYRNGHREQYIRALAEPIQPEDVPAVWKNVPIVHVGPLAREVDARFAKLFPDSLVGVTPQGWLRQWDGSGRVRMRPWDEAAEILPQVDCLVLSEEDLNGKIGLIDEYAAMTRIAVMTQGARGCMIYQDGKTTQVPGYPVAEVDPTGAGDVFAAAFLIRLEETRDAIESARFANATASFCVQAAGVIGIPTRAEVEKRMESYR
jgi:sugar/nucleoside kinase (ribokinase family)